MQVVRAVPHKLRRGDVIMEKESPAFTEEAKRKLYAILYTVIMRAGANGQLKPKVIKESA